jgi:YidC/Oxa1 family membrane protein insertase
MNFLQPILGPIEQVIWGVLNFFHNMVGDWGLSIILLVIVIRVALLPLTWKQTKSMYELQRLQPKIKALQEKYKNDQQKLNEETMKFYSENKVNPLGGCLPLLLQMPIFFALFGVLNQLGNVKSAFYIKGLTTFYFVIPNLVLSPSKVFSQQGIVAAIPYAVLVVLFALSIYLPQRLMQPNADPQQSRITLIMSVMMLWFGWVSPAGVLLYWVTSSVLQIIQQFVQMRILSTSEGASK